MAVSTLWPYFTLPLPIPSETVRPNLFLLAESWWVPLPDAPQAPVRTGCRERQGPAHGHRGCGDAVAFAGVLGRSVLVSWDLSCP